MTCPDCGHPTYFHRANTVDQRHKLDGPVPCFAAVGMLDTDPPSFVYCGCTTVHAS